MRSRIEVIEPELKLKHERMCARPFVFFRATFYRWVDYLRSTQDVFRGFTRVAGMGDAHIENFGTWRDEEGRLVWGANDLDEACVQPWISDVLRLAVSARLAIDEGSLHAKAGEACDAILLGYIDSMNTGGQPHVLAERSTWLRDIALARMKKPGAYWDKMNASLRVGTPPEKLRRLLKNSMPKDVTELRYFRRVAGAGSLGRPRWVAQGLLHGSYCAREAKAWLPSAAVWADDGAKKADTKLQMRLIKRTAGVRDPIMRTEAGWTIKRVGAEHGRIELDEIREASDISRLLGAMGSEVANLHLADPSKRERIVAEAKTLSLDTFRALVKDLEERVVQDQAAYAAGASEPEALNAVVEKKRR